MQIIINKTSVVAADPPALRIVMRSKKIPLVKARTVMSSVVDPNPKKMFGFGYGFRHCCRMKIVVKNKNSNT
jgi:hypothetical protein